MVDQILEINNKDLIGAKIIEANVEKPYSSSHITIMTTGGKKYNIFPECEDSQSAEWFDIMEL
jgi:hypothetical protein